MRHGVPWHVVVPILGLLPAAACHTGSLDPGPEAYEYRVPEVTGDGWETASLADVGMAEAPLVRLMNDLRGMEGHLVHGIVVVRHGKLVFEEYFPGLMFSLARYTGGVGFDRDDAHNLASVTKSITTTLFGIALDRGLIPSVAEPVFDYFPEHADLLREDPRRAGMTLEHLMTMTSGIAWNDEAIPYSDPRNDLVRMFTSEDPIRYALATPLYATPGTDFEYCNANTNILGEVIRRATGQRLDDFAADHLFSPLGIVVHEWQMVSEARAVVFASGDLRLRPRDMAKIGQLFLQRGSWRGREVVSPEWVAAATARRVSPDGPHAWADGYGYGWWHWDLSVGEEMHHAYMAAGWGGQWIVVLPEDDVVFVATGGSYYDAAPLPADRMLTEYVLRALP